MINLLGATNDSPSALSGIMSDVFSSEAVPTVGSDGCGCSTVCKSPALWGVTLLSPENAGVTAVLWVIPLCSDDFLGSDLCWSGSAIVPALATLAGSGDVKITHHNSTFRGEMPPLNYNEWILQQALITLNGNEP